ncbi:ABC transporter ATP-binding protein [Microbulbifer sp. 2201CG32-9]|uniref:ABC transporter ATP-binding protein n=1 Tax=Microbulbifer sp. 2201CG32-9 TaxID=3232309 RepID=UPI00345B9AC4
MVQPLLEITEIECRHGDRIVLEQVSFHLHQGEICCLLGPSGCGKTTLLHAVAGFNPVYRGQISLAGRPISTASAVTPPERRNIGVVFQDYALFPHLTVQQNIAFGLKSAPQPERRARVRELLQLVRLESHADKFPHQLSGGQQQRVALVRALAPRPGLLLMDEPFSNLDTELRRSLASEVRHILREQGTSAILVTHDRNEAFAAADQLGVLTGGRLQQWDTPENIFRHPASLSVARIVSDGFVVTGKLVREGLLQTEIGRLAPAPMPNLDSGEVRLFVRNEALLPGDHADAVAAQVVDKSFLGDRVIYKLRLPQGRVIETTFATDYRLEPGSEVPLRIGEALIFSDH